MALAARSFIPLLLALLPVFHAQALELRPGGEHVLPGQASLQQQRLLERLQDLPPSQPIRRLYEAYQAAARASGHDFRIDLSSFETLGYDQFRSSRWIDLMTPPTGVWVSQSRHYVEATWLDQEAVFYDLQTRIRDPRQESVTFESLSRLRDHDILDALQGLAGDGLLPALPYALTTYRVRVRLGGWSRSYRAAAFWYPTAAEERFEFVVQDHVVPEVQSIAGDTARPVDHLTYESLRIRRPDLRSEGRAVGEVTIGSCIADNRPVRHNPLEIGDSQGHSAGSHTASMGMQANCVYDGGCYVQCQPQFHYKSCGEEVGSDVKSGCTHTGHYDSRVSGAGASDDSVSCGAALACGIKECCWGIFCGGVSLSFSGSGGGLTATASSSGGGAVYNLSLDDRVECAAPKKEDPCLANSGSSTLDGGLSVAWSALYIPCGDGTGGTGADGPTAGDGGAQGDGTPVLIDFGGRGFELSSTAGGVAFDLDADGTVERISWTLGGSDDAFLVLDRNGNGLIDDGRELFGDATAQPAGQVRHGYRALAVFDQPAEGGNGDGFITAQDQVFASLEVWWDRNHDGVSQPDERTLLAATGVVALDLDYVESARRDPHGNLVRYTSKAHLQEGSGRPHLPMADVLFQYDQP